MWLDSLRAMKSNSGLTTKEIAERSGLPEPTLEKLFAGATKDPKLGTLSRLVHFFGYTLDDLENDSPVISSLPPAPALPPAEKALLEQYRNAPLDIQRAVQSILAPYSPAVPQSKTG